MAIVKITPGMFNIINVTGGVVRIELPRSQPAPAVRTSAQQVHPGRYLWRVRLAPLPAQRSQLPRNARQRLQVLSRLRELQLP